MSKSKLKEGSIIYYSKDQKDDFGTAGHNGKPLKPDFKYINNNIFYRIFSFILFYVFAHPILYVIAKISEGVRVYGKKNLKEVNKKEGYFLYLNHVNYIDAYIPHVFLSQNKRCYILSHPDPVNIPFVGTLTMMLGCLPIPTSTDISNYKKFLKALKYRVNQNRVIAIYPEGTLWPYYTKVRPFPESSFKYAVQTKKPIFVVAETYRKPKFPFKKPRVNLTISKVIRVDETLSDKENVNKYYNEATAFLNEMVDNESNYKYYDYREKEEA